MSWYRLSNKSRIRVRSIGTRWNSILLYSSRSSKVFLFLHNPLKTSPVSRSYYNLGPSKCWSWERSKEMRRAIKGGTTEEMTKVRAVHKIIVLIYPLSKCSCLMLRRIQRTRSIVCKFLRKKEELIEIMRRHLKLNNLGKWGMMGMSQWHQRTIGINWNNSRILDLKEWTSLWYQGMRKMLRKFKAETTYLISEKWMSLMWMIRWFLQHKRKTRWIKKVSRRKKKQNIQRNRKSNRNKMFLHQKNKKHFKCHTSLR